MAKKNRASIDPTIDCACVIHGSGYDWVYVDKLYNMLCKYLHRDIRFHVYTEIDRPVPDHMIKHNLIEWHGISGPKKSWWYKLQLFNAEHHSGNLLYFDLDTLIIRDINWIPELSTDKFWTIKDFRYLQAPGWDEINSSVMWWNVKRFDWVWQQFKQLDINTIIRTYRGGDQAYLTKAIDYQDRRYFSSEHTQSWRWECLDGGTDFTTRKARNPGTGTVIADLTSIVVFHGTPKPHEINDPVVKQLWQ